MTIEHPSRFAASDPDRPAVIAAESGQVLTYGQLETRSNQLAHLLRARGLGVGAHVAIVVENRPEYFEVVWGATRSGAYVTPINWHLSAEEIEYVVRDCGADALIVSAACAASVPMAIGGVRLVLGGTHEGFESYEAVISEQPTTPLADECEGTWMFYSSGTTGRPKGIKPATIGGPIGSPTGFVGLVQMLYGGNEATRYLSPAPLYHAAPSGWATAIHRIGGTVVITERFDPLGFLDAIDRYGVTLAQVVPTHMVRLLKLPVSDRARLLAGEPRQAGARSGAVPARREAGDDRLARAPGARVLLGQRRRRLLRDRTRGMVGPSRLGRQVSPGHRPHRRRGRQRVARAQ